MEVEENKYFTMLAHNSFDSNSTLEILNFDGNFDFSWKFWIFIEKFGF